MNLKIGLLGLSMAISSTLIGGCASTQKLSHEQIMSQHQQVANLDSALQQARSKGAEYLAPESYIVASNALQRAVSEAEDNNTNAAKMAATEGLKTVTKLNHNTEYSRDILSEVVDARNQAYSAGANTLQRDKMADMDKDLIKTSTMIENGDIEEAKQKRPNLIQGYAQLELAALKLGTANLAKTSIVQAKQQGAKKYAPKTLARAEEEMALAVTILDADRTQIAKADVYAKKAKWLAEQSASITETVKDFDRRDYSLEDIVLWHQLQLKSVNEPLTTELPFNESNKKVVLSLKNSVRKVIAERNTALEQGNKTEQQLNTQLKTAEEKYGKQLALTEKERKALLQKDLEDKQKFDRVQALFTANEANVYRQRQNILISAHGFQFPSGQSEIQTGNFSLMNKITRAIKTFPNARIEVNGHTDSRGDENINKTLSEARALKVAKFLNEVGEIADAKMTSRGFGETRPVASNETVEGRAENRRVEIKIINE